MASQGSIQGASQTLMLHSIILVQSLSSKEV
jgi:hypothetical protein